MRIEHVNINGSLNRAVGVLRSGGAVFVPGPAVWGWVIDSRSDVARQSVVDKKGEARLKKPFAVLTTADKAKEWIDWNKVNRDVTDAVFLNGLANLAGGISFLRAPVKESTNLNPCVLSEDGKMVQVFIADGSPWLAQQTRLAEEHGIVQAITSVNGAGQPEIVDLFSGILFGFRKGVEKILVNGQALGPRSSVRGSYTIIELSNEGLALRRPGNTDLQIHADVWQLPVATTANLPRRQHASGQIARQALPGDLVGPALRKATVDALVSGGRSLK